VNIFSQNQDQIIRQYGKLNNSDIQLSCMQEQVPFTIYLEPTSSIKKSNATLIIGETLIGLSLGTILIGGPIALKSDDLTLKQTIVYTALGLCVTGIILTAVGASAKKRAITIYNPKVNMDYNASCKIDLGLTQNGIGFIYIF